MGAHFTLKHQRTLLSVYKSAERTGLRNISSVSLQFAVTLIQHREVTSVHDAMVKHSKPVHASSLILMEAW
jgi:hypothetical protein